MNWLTKIFRSTFDKNYRHFSMVEGMTNFKPSMSLESKIALVLKNPAFLKVVALQCDLFSLGKFYVYKDGEEVEDHPLLKTLKNPNPFQNSQEFLWEYMFWQMLGVSQVFIDDRDYQKLIPNKMYLLRPYSLKFPDDMRKSADKIILSKKSLDEYNKQDIVYRYNDGTTFKFKYGQLVTVSDLGHISSRLDSHSRVDALLKVIFNNEASMDSMNINIRYSGKFMVAGTADPDDVTKLPLSKEEKEDIEKKALNNNPVEAVKSMIDIKRFVENAAAQKLDDFYLHTFFVIGSMYNIPRDVLEASASSTYENQEKARGAHIDYCLQPKADLLTNKLDKYFGMEGETVVLSWDHLPFMQVFEEQRTKAQYSKTQSVLNLLRAGVPIEEINEFLDTTFTTDETKQKLGGNINENTQGNQGQETENGQNV